MNPYIESQQIEELNHFDPYEMLSEDPTILDEDEDRYDDASFSEMLNSTNDF
jgi:hypothetical protein